MLMKRYNINDDFQKRSKKLMLCVLYCMKRKVVFKVVESDNLDEMGFTRFGTVQKRMMR